jgi:hypothetical protein
MKKKTVRNMEWLIIISVPLCLLFTMHYAIAIASGVLMLFVKMGKEEVNKYIAHCIELRSRRMLVHLVTLSLVFLAVPIAMLIGGLLGLVIGAMVFLTAMSLQMVYIYQVSLNENTVREELYRDIVPAIIFLISIFVFLETESVLLFFATVLMLCFIPLEMGSMIWEDSCEKGGCKVGM